MHKYFLKKIQKGIKDLYVAILSSKGCHVVNGG